MDVRLNNGALVTNVTPFELEALIAKGLVGKTVTTTSNSIPPPMRVAGEVDNPFQFAVPGPSGVTPV